MSDHLIGLSLGYAVMNMSSPQYRSQQFRLWERGGANVPTAHPGTALPANNAQATNFVYWDLFRSHFVLFIAKIRRSDSIKKWMTVMQDSILPSLQSINVGSFQRIVTPNTFCCKCSGRRIALNYQLEQFRSNIQSNNNSIITTARATEKMGVKINAICRL